MNHTAALPDPDHTDPEHLRWVADILEARGADSDAHNFWFTPIDRVADTAARVRLDADRIERERAERDATEKLIEAVVQSLADNGIRFQTACGRETVVDAARALHAAGLLRKSDQ